MKTYLLYFDIPYSVDEFVA